MDCLTKCYGITFGQIAEGVLKIIEQSDKQNEQVDATETSTIN